MKQQRQETDQKAACASLQRQGSRICVTVVYRICVTVHTVRALHADQRAGPLVLATRRHTEREAFGDRGQAPAQAVITRWVNLPKSSAWQWPGPVQPRLHGPNAHATISGNSSRQ